MAPRRITVSEARAYFRDPSQQIEGVTPENLPEKGLEYWACGPVCGAFNAAPWPGVIMGHYAVMPQSWGRLTGPAMEILRAVWGAKNPQRIIGWTPADNRAALAFARRLGFEIDGHMTLASGRRIVMQGWRL